MLLGFAEPVSITLTNMEVRVKKPMKLTRTEKSTSPREW
jgi:hypothetical protein